MYIFRKPAADYGELLLTNIEAFLDATTKIIVIEDKIEELKEKQKTLKNPGLIAANERTLKKKQAELEVNIEKEYKAAKDIKNLLARPDVKSFINYSRDNKGVTALWLAAINNLGDLVIDLLKSGADPNITIKHDEKQTRIETNLPVISVAEIEATYSGSNILWALCDTIRCHDSDSRLAFIAMLIHGFPDVEFEGADPNYVDLRDNLTPIGRVLYSESTPLDKKIAIVVFLLQNGALSTLPLCIDEAPYKNYPANDTIEDWASRTLPNNSPLRQQLEKALGGVKLKPKHDPQNASQTMPLSHEQNQGTDADREQFAEACSNLLSKLEAVTSATPAFAILKLLNTFQGSELMTKIVDKQLFKREQSTINGFVADGENVYSSGKFSLSQIRSLPRNPDTSFKVVPMNQEQQKALEELKQYLTFLIAEYSKDVKRKPGLSS